MVKIFREMRQELATQNKVAKYLRYAVGEILLVVIGILIALQVNNWNELRKNVITSYSIHYTKLYEFPSVAEIKVSSPSSFLISSDIIFSKGSSSMSIFSFSAM